MYFLGILSLAVTASAGSRASIASLNQEKWDAFNSTISGRLHNGQPMLAPCFYRYNGQSQRPGAECSTVQKNKGASESIVDYFGGYQYVNWASCQSTGQSCALSFFLNPDYITPLASQCYQGSVPSKYVDVREVRDVQEALNFATENNIRVVIKNTGHDYKGRSSAPDALGIWTHNYTPALKLEKGFVPEGCSAPVGDVITFGAGQMFGPLYDFAHKNKVRVVGGTSQTVGAAGGWLTGGGHSILSNELGLGVDNAQQIRAVLPNGTYITANRCQNTDVFFALRGGGGGTFGVVMEVSTLAHPDKPMVMARFTIPTLNPGNIEQLISILVDNAEKWADEGFGGYVYPGLATGFYSTALLATSKLSEAGAREMNITTVPGIYDIVGPGATSLLSNANNLGAAMSSRLIPRHYFQDQSSRAKLSSILYDIFRAGQTNTQIPVLPLQLNLVAPASYKLLESDKPGGPGASSITPVWRESLWHVIHTREWDGTTTSSPTVQRYWQATHDAMRPLREFTPDSGAYINEADTFEPNFEESFWGAENYARLMEIKRDIDLDNLLTVHQGVGYEEDDKRYQCYPDVAV
ncbi:FAD-binding domain-containing protein [Aspergillus keveii]|uniref:FAD-binding domain-containing protein n=1 Tax=Aspergillus keveii TaxID=714993 RepID=A0ABR4GP73_9EURO